MKMKAVKYALLASLAGHGLHIPNEKHIETHPSARRGRKAVNVLSAPATTRCLYALQDGMHYAVSLCRCVRCH